MNKNPPKNKLLYYIMTEDPWAKIFWRIWFWWGIRQARKRKLENEERIAEMRKSENEKNSS